MSAAAASPSTSSGARPRGAEKGANAPFFYPGTRNEPESKPLRAVRPAGALYRRTLGARSALSRAAARGASGPLRRRARRRAARVDAACDARERSLSNPEIAAQAGRLHPAVARRRPEVRDEHRDAHRIPDGTDELARAHRSRFGKVRIPASIAIRLARRERENL